MPAKQPRLARIESANENYTAAWTSIYGVYELGQIKKILAKKKFLPQNAKMDFIHKNTFCLISLNKNRCIFRIYNTELHLDACLGCVCITLHLEACL